MNTTIEFTEDYEVKGEGGKTYKKGQRVTLPVASARHFVNRNKAKTVILDHHEPRKRGPKPKNVGIDSVGTQPDTGASRLLPGTRKGVGDK